MLCVCVLFCSFAIFFSPYDCHFATFDPHLLVSLFLILSFHSIFFSCLVFCFFLCLLCHKSVLQFLCLHWMAFIRICCWCFCSCSSLSLSSSFGSFCALLFTLLFVSIFLLRKQCYLFLLSKENNADGSSVNDLQRTAAQIAIYSTVSI